MPVPAFGYPIEVSQAFAEVAGKAGDISAVIEKEGGRQTELRDGAINVINDLADALQLACDHVSAAVSASVIEYSSLSREDEAMKAFFARTAFKFSEPALRQMLHEGKVCGALYRLSDQLRQPFSGVGTAGVPIWQLVAAFFTRSTRMSKVVNGLREAETEYLYAVGALFRAVVTTAEDSRGAVGRQLTVNGDLLVGMMRERRESLQLANVELRRQATACIAALA